MTSVKGSGLNVCPSRGHCAHRLRAWLIEAFLILYLFSLCAFLRQIHSLELLPELTTCLRWGPHAFGLHTAMTNNQYDRIIIKLALMEERQNEKPLLKKKSVLGVQFF